MREFNDLVSWILMGHKDDRRRLYANDLSGVLMQRGGDAASAEKAEAIRTYAL